MILKTPGVPIPAINIRMFIRKSPTLEQEAHSGPQLFLPKKGLITGIRERKKSFDELSKGGIPTDNHFASPLGTKVLYVTILDCVNAH